LAREGQADKFGRRWTLMNAAKTYTNGMEIHLAPELEAKIDQIISESGYPLEKLIENALAGYVPELRAKREMLDSRYDDLKSGRVKPISGDEVVAHLREKSAAARRTGRGQ
jgi:hypothetical protein